MCCAFIDKDGNLVRPGKPVAYRKKNRSTGSAPWAGFARSEILPW